MTIDYTTVGAGAIAVVSVALIAAEVLKRVLGSRLAACAKKVADSSCPRCHRLLTGAATAGAVQTKQRFFGARGRLHGRDYPYRLLRLLCPHCKAALHFRLDATLFSCDHIVGPAEPGGPANRSQPVGSEANRAPSAAGSGG